MFKKILIANRGEIAVRAVRTCKEMGITAVTLYDPSDINSLHVRQADETVQISSPEFFMDGAALIKLAQQIGAEAIYPGYGFLAEDIDFAAACEQAGVTFIGPPAAILQQTRHKTTALTRVREAGFDTVISSPGNYGRDDLADLRTAAADLGYPLVVKPCRGGRGRGARFIPTADALDEATRQTQEASQILFRDRQVYLEKAIMPAHQIGVQIVADVHGNLVHLGEREGSIMYHNQKVLEESPSPSLTSEQRAELWQTAVAIARLFNFQNVGTVEFIVGDDALTDGVADQRRFYFSEIKARIQVDHPLTEVRTGIDLIREQICIAAGERLAFAQADVPLRGSALMVRIQAEDPMNHFLPSPGLLRRMRLPTGPDIRVDSYAYSGCHVPAAYDPLFAKLTVWGQDRATTVSRMRWALADFLVVGLPTNIALLQQLVAAETFVNGRYHTGTIKQPAIEVAEAAPHLRDLAVIAAVFYVRRNQQSDPSVPDRLLSGWHRDSRRIGG